MSEAFRRLLHTNRTVCQIYTNGGTAEDACVALAAENEAMLKRILELESIAPKKIKGPDGTVYVWHCPTELIPEQP